MSKEYGQLGTLLELLAERAARQAELSVEGEVLPGRPVRIRLDAPADGLRQRRVTIHADPDEEHQTQVSRVEDGRVVTVDAMRNWDVPAGARVRVVAASRFAMRQNAEALNRFNRGAVEGAWEDLATLLCETERLCLPGPVPMPRSFFCDTDPGSEPLNEPQRRAVAGALATPHAFLVQGPPGTGKTTVISELIQQLIARGERVLMLAPSHVAVDEVLRRVGPKPGVQALRITWSADKVDAELHPYLFDRVGRDLAGRVLREGANRRARWQARAAELDERLAELADLRDAFEDEHARTAAYLTAASDLTQLREAAPAARAEAERRVTEAARRLEAALRGERSAQDSAAAAAQEVARLDSEVRPGLVALRTAAEAGLASIEAVEKAQEAEADAEGVVTRWAATINAIDARLRQWRVYAAHTEPALNARLAEARDRLGWLRSRMAQPPGTPQGWLDRLGLGAGPRRYFDVQRAEREWRHWADLRARFEASAASAVTDERNVAEYRGHLTAWRK
ncbi:MAG TPA: AAA domain-containing protein, partial [Actinomycetota bacterium]|nr:AAA domain-containing protein [Actinomycetota bacterium]